MLLLDWAGRPPISWETYVKTMASLTRGSLFRTLALEEVIARIVVIRDMYRRATPGNMWSIQIAGGMGSLRLARITRITWD